MLIPQIGAALITASALALGTVDAYGQASPGPGQTTSTGSGQAFPSKPVRIVTGGIGTNSESLARLVAHGLSETAGQQFIVDSRGGIISMEAVVKAPPDGYTLLLQGSGVWLLPLMRDNVPWDPLRDFVAITVIASSPNVLVVHPSLPVKSVKDLIALAKVRPGALNYGSGNTGSTSHLAPELFKSMAGLDIVRIAYKGSGQAINALVAGEVQVGISSAGAVTPQIKAGRLRALAVTDAKRSALVPGLPTVAESGLPGYESGTIACLFAPGKTPDAIVRRLNQLTVQVLGRTDTKDKFYSIGVEPGGSSLEDVAATLKSEVRRLGKVIKDAGIRDE